MPPPPPPPARIPDLLYIAPACLALNSPVSSAILWPGCAKPKRTNKFVQYRESELIDYTLFFGIWYNYCTSRYRYIAGDLCCMWVWIYSLGDMQVVPQYEFYANVALEIKIFVFKEIYFLCTIKTSHFIELEMNICEYRISAVRSRGKKASQTSQQSSHHPPSLARC